MADIRRVLRTIRAQNGLDQKGLADLLGVSRSAVANWETGHANMDEQYKVKLERLFPEMADVETPRAAKSAWKIKVWGSISAGDGQGNTAPPDLNETYIPADFNRDDYGALTVQGDSMLDFLQPSDIVIFKDWKQEKIGHVMAARLPGGEWVVKQLVYRQGKFALHSLNPTYPDIPIEGVQLAGYLVGIVRDDGDERLIRLNPRGLKPPVNIF